MQTQNTAVSLSPAKGVIPHSVGCLNAYSAAISRFDLLEPAREQQLARRWQEGRDRRATDELITSHLRLAAKVARGYKGYGLPVADLIAEANLGLVIAASRFQPGRGARFSSYALWWMKATIHEYILRSWSLVKIGTTAAQKKLFFRLRGEMRKLAGEAAVLTPEIAQAIADRLEVTARDVVEMDGRLAGDLSLSIRSGDNDRPTEWEAMLVDDAPDAEEIVAEHDQTMRRSKALRAALGVLTERERRVFEARRLAEQPLTLDHLGRELCISSERVRQIEALAYAKVRRATISALQDLRRAAADLNT
ncbi:RNA polymerase factor sigma-32 [Bradyrhizobium vignae]|uniref:RNA polymerase factor sigma-32 n=1 Tax=Bradyrhizobium vignae TaxID=1549949 RepID=UPI00100ACBAE|nr:RNA polymerase factor sigma-32 [Bradyrhizobium vignae]RXG86214.1 sigma-70 family RNA polymerase sigma factor [Bradyrhizobium vignae]